MLSAFYNLGMIGIVKGNAGICMTASCNLPCSDCKRHDYFCFIDKDITNRLFGYIADHTTDYED